MQVGSWCDECRVAAEEYKGLHELYSRDLPAERLGQTPPTILSTPAHLQLLSLGFERSNLVASRFRSSLRQQGGSARCKMSEQSNLAFHSTRHGLPCAEH